MSEIDLLNDLLNSNPNSPASKGEMLLLRLETKSEFKLLRSELTQKFSEIDGKFERVYQRFDQIDRRLDQMDKRLDRMDERLDRIDLRFVSLDNTLRGMAEQIAILVERSVSR